MVGAGGPRGQMGQSANEVITIFARKGNIVIFKYPRCRRRQGSATASAVNYNVLWFNTADKACRPPGQGARY